MSRYCIVCCGWMLLLLLTAPAAAATRGTITIQVTDADTGKPIAVRMHVKDRKGKAVKPPKSVYWKDHFVFDGETELSLLPGDYTFVMERGPEYRVREGYFTIERTSEDTKQVTMQRFADLKKEGWWSGELHVHRDPKLMPLLMAAEDLHVAPVITWWNDRNAWEDGKLPENPLVRLEGERFYHVMGGEDERGGGALLYFNLDRPLPIQGLARETPSPASFLKPANQQAAAHIDIEKPFWWDMPIWVASQMVDSIGICNNHQWRSGVLDGEAWGKPRDLQLYPGPQGNGRWSQDIYYRLLNCGIRLPPSAGSASGVLPNPVGYNRAYVHCEGPLSYESWFAGLKAGRVVVTNGPLLRPLVNGKLPGHVFEVAQGASLDLDVALRLSLRETVDYLEVVQDGKVVHEVRLDDYAKRNGHLPPVTFKQSGWMLVRAVTSHPDSYRFASTGPYYVQVGDKRRVSKQDAEFFLAWVHERARNLKIEDPEQKAEVLRYHRAARDFWKARVESANAP